MKTDIKKNPIRFNLGNDSEFIMIHRGKCAPMIGNANDETGYDGTGFHKISEVRSYPSECPLEIVNFIRQAFVRKVKKYPQVLNYTWKAGSFFLHPIGSHFHFDVKKETISHELANRIVSDYCGGLSILLEDKQEAFDRRNCEEGEYGRPSDFRFQEIHGGFESRVFSSALSSPAIMAAHLCLVKTVMYELLNNKKFEPNLKFTDNDFSEVKINKFKNNFDKIWSEISGMQLYSQYKEYIDIIKFLILNDRTWFSCDKKGVIQDMRVTWGLTSNEIPAIQQPKLPKYTGNPIFENL